MSDETTAVEEMAEEVSEEAEAEETPEEEAAEVEADDDTEASAGEAEAEEDDDESEEEDEPEAPAALDGEEWEAVQSRPVTRKVNGEEVTRTVAEWVQQAQKAEGAERKFDEAARLRKEAEEKQAEVEEKLSTMEEDVRAFVNDLADPEKLIGALAGLSDRHQWAIQRAFEQHVTRQMEDAKLTPEQRKLRQLEREMEAQKRQRQQETAAQKRQREEQERKAKEEREQAFRDQQTRIVLDAMAEAGIDREKNEEDWKAVGRLVMPDLRDALEQHEKLDPEEVKALVQKYAKRLGVGKAAAPKPKAKAPPKVREGAAKRGGRPKKKAPKKVSAGSFFDQLKAEADYDAMYDVEIG